MTLQFYNTPQPESLNSSLLADTSPSFLGYKPNLEEIQKALEEHNNLENVLVIAHGGSITSFYGMYYSLKYQAKKKAFFLSTVDPDYILELKKELSPENTLVLSISKSGTTVTQLEALSQFLDYPTIVVTESGTPMEKIASSVNAKVITHPPIGGRYTAFTEVGVLPAVFVGLDVSEMLEGAKAMHDQFRDNNPAWDLASVMHQLEQKGFVDVFMPFYSHSLFPMSALIVQLCHESFGKAGKGQSYLAMEAPESQHHTNQRFFGGTKNIAGIFTSVEKFNSDAKINYPEGSLEVGIRGGKLSDINNFTLSSAMHAELHGTLEDAKSKGIPVATALLEDLSAREVGKYVAFWQMYAVYASLLRGVDPFDQPQVESSKKISFEYRVKAKKS